MHSIYAPSSSNRWLNCPGSLFLNQYESSGVNRLRGSLIHKHVCDCIIRNDDDLTSDIYKMDCVEDQETLIDAMEEMEAFLSYINLMNLEGLKVEQRVDLTHIIPECFGTADIVGTTKDTLHVIDLKTGFFKVPSKENHQLMLYALGYYDPKIHKEIKLHIFQYNKPCVYTVTDEFLQKIRQEISSFLLDLATEPNTYREGSWCRFCPSIISCPKKRTRIDQVNRLSGKNPLLMSFKELETLFVNKHELDPLFNKVQKLVEHEMINNNVSSDLIFCGTKKGRRIIKFDSLIAYAKEFNLEAELLSSKPKTLSELKKTLSADILENLTESSEIKFVGIKYES